jgi:hypothetical protein
MRGSSDTLAALAFDSGKRQHLVEGQARLDGMVPIDALPAILIELGDILRWLPQASIHW